MTSTTTSLATTSSQHSHHLPLHKQKGVRSRVRAGHSLRKCPTHLLAYSIISILVFLCWLPDFIVALKDVSVTIPQAVKRGSNAMLTCNYDMENDTLYSVKWYKGRREFYRYTPKENPAMKVFPSQSGLTVERNLSNQSHVVLLAVPLNISGKFTCEISVEAPSFQTAMVSGEMEVVELPEEQASVTGIQPRYRIGDLVDGNCSIKYSKPAANLTWTINGIVVPPHHIKTYQIEKYEETNLESVMSAIHFMVTTQHFVKGQMRLKCTASIFNIFKEEIESVIEEDRPRIMASGQSYPPDHGYGTHGESDGYEHNESYLTYFSAPKSSASRTAEFFITKILKYLQQEILHKFHLSLSLDDTKSQHMENTLVAMTFIKSFKMYLLEKITQIKMTATTMYFEQLQQQLMPIECLITVMVILLVVIRIQMKKIQRNYCEKATTTNEIKCNCCLKENKKNLAVNLWHENNFNKNKRRQHQQQHHQPNEKLENENCYHDANNDDCQNKIEQRRQQQEQELEQQRQQHDEQCLVANQNVVNEKLFLNDTNIATLLTRKKTTNEMTTSSSPSIAPSPTIIDCQRHVSQTLFTIPSSSSFASFCAMPSLSSASKTWGYSKTSYAHDSLPLYAFDASKSNNAKYMSKDQTLLMTSPTSTANTAAVVAAVVVATSYSTSTLKNFIAAPPPSSSEPVPALGAGDFKLLQTSVQPLPLPSPSSSSVSRNNYLMAFIGELLLHQC